MPEKGSRVDDFAADVETRMENALVAEEGLEPPTRGL